MSEDATTTPLADASARRPWFLWLVDTSPFGAAATGTIAAAVLLAVQLLAWTLLSRAWGFPLETSARELRPMMFFAVVLAFGPAGVAWCAQMARGDLERLRPILTFTAPAFEQYRSGLERPPVRQTLMLLAGLLVAAVVGMEANVGRISTVLGPDRTPFDGYIVAVSLLTMVVVASPLLLMLRLAVGFRRIGTHHVAIDLYDLHALAPFGRFGVRTSLVPLGVFGLGLGVGTNIHVGGVLVATLVIGGMSLAALLLPSLGVRRRILAAKTEEIDCVTRALKGDREALAHARLREDAPRLTLPELLAYRREIAGLREWPIADDGWRRFAAYLLIPLSTWTIKAMVGSLVGKVF